jgi:dihydrofolate reductase
MGRIVVVENMTLDGVMQAPGRPDEDRRGGFARGGWAVPYVDSILGQVMGADMARGGALLFGRRTYEDFFGYWPRQVDNPFTPVLDERRKYVASRTLSEPLPWRNSTLLEGDAAGAVADLRRRAAEDLTVMGSGELVQSLRQRDLVDDFVLLIHPLVFGSGRRLFPDDSPSATLRLVEVTPTTTGVLIARYRAAGKETAT